MASITVTAAPITEAPFTAQPAAAQPPSGSTQDEQPATAPLPAGSAQAEYCTYPFPRTAHTTVRFIRVEPFSRYKYTFEYHTLADLPHLSYQFLSYHDPFHPLSQQLLPACPPTETYHAITIDSTPVFVPPYLFACLGPMHVTGHYQAHPSNLWFIPPLCLDPYDRPSYLTHQAAYLSRYACRTVVWLGLLPESPYNQHHVGALSRIVHFDNCDHDAWDHDTWTRAAAARQSLADHPHWSALDAVRELLLCQDVDDKMVVWCCGGVKLPANVFEATTWADMGGPCGEVSAAERAMECCAGMGFEEVCYSTGGREEDGTEFLPGSLEELMEKMEGEKKKKIVVKWEAKKPGEHGKTVNELVGGGVVMRLECEDRRDRLYGLVDVLKETSRTKVAVDYNERGVEWAFEQALRIGLEELAEELPPDIMDDLDIYWTAGRDCSWVQTYYREAREVFGIDEDEGDQILSRVVRKMGLKQWHAHVDKAGEEGLSFGEFQRVSASAYRLRNKDSRRKRWSKRVKDMIRRRKGFLSRRGVPKTQTPGSPLGK